MKKIIMSSVLFACIASLAVISCGGGEGGSDENISIPIAPTAPVITAGNGKLVLNWEAVSGATSYTVWYNDDNNSGTATQSGADISSLSHTITGLDNGATYYVWLKSKHAGGASDWGSVADGIPMPPPRDDLRGEWLFSGNANDTSGNNSATTVYGATLATDRFGNVYSAYSFNGTSDYIQTDVNSNTLPLSYSVWFNLQGTTGAHCIVDSDVGGHCGHSIAYTYTQNLLQVEYHDQWTIIDNTLLENNQWYHLVVNYSDTIEVYLNGVLIHEEVYPTATLDGSNYRFGRHSLPSGNYYNGYMDDIRIYYRVLTQDEVLLLYCE